MDTKTLMPYNPVNAIFYGMSMGDLNLYAQHFLCVQNEIVFEAEIRHLRMHKLD